MKKIPCLYVRNLQTHKLTEEITPGCEWVFEPGAWATRKWDGTSVLIEKQKFYKRREVKPKQKIPEGFIEVEVDKKTGKRFGWIAIDFKEPDNKWHQEACSYMVGLHSGTKLIDGTYELCGPMVQGNPENLKEHRLIPHGKVKLGPVIVKSFNYMKEWIQGCPYEGVVFYHSDGRRAKIKKVDFGFKR